MSKSKFFQAAKLNTGTVSVDGYGDIELHELTLKQRLDLNGFASDDQDIGRAKVIVMCCDLFTDNDIDALCKIKSSVLLELFNKAMALSGVGDDDKKKP